MGCGAVGVVAPIPSSSMTSTTQILVGQNGRIQFATLLERAAIRVLRWAGVIFRIVPDFRGSTRIGSWAGRLFGPNRTASVSLARDAKFSFQLRDAYWNRLLMKGFRYEPEIERVLYRLREIDYVFFDCGANF